MKAILYSAMIVFLFSLNGCRQEPIKEPVVNIDCCCGGIREQKSIKEVGNAEIEKIKEAGRNKVNEINKYYDDTTK